MSETILSVSDLKVYFPMFAKGGGFLARKVDLKAVDGVSFDLKGGETLGVVGESGCGKSTLGRAILQLIKPTAGNVIWLGDDLAKLKKREMREKRQDLQIIFQDPLASLDPRMTIGDIIAEPLTSFFPKMSKFERKEKVQTMMENVGLLPQMINRYPHEFSGGQCQRIGVARAMILEPKLIICDEPVSALDVSIQAQIVNLLKDLQERFDLSLIFISHDLSVIRHISHRVLVLYLGNVMEIADRNDIYERPRHPYTQALISAAPIPDPDLERNKQRLLIEGDLPSPIDPPSGCVFRTRCPKAADICSNEKPTLESNGADGTHEVACHFPD
jgi:oligopeptide transport system ATP-binding protein